MNDFYLSNFSFLVVHGDNKYCSNDNVSSNKSCHLWSQNMPHVSNVSTVYYYLHYQNDTLMNHILTEFLKQIWVEREWMNEWSALHVLCSAACAVKVSVFWVRLSKVHYVEICFTLLRLWDSWHERIVTLVKFPLHSRIRLKNLKK